MTLTERIAQIRELEKKATPGPWTFRDHVGYDTAVGSCGEEFIIAAPDTPTGCDADDAAFIVAMRNILSDLLDRLEAVEKERDAFANDLWSAEDQWGDDYLWKKWRLSKNLTQEVKDRLAKRDTKEGNKS